MAEQIPRSNRPYNSRSYTSLQPGDPRHLPFNPNEFINACVLVRDGPFVEENENWMRVVRMYDRMIKVRIDPIEFTKDCPREALAGSSILRELLMVDEAPIGPHLFGLPFSVHDFLAICAECERFAAEGTQEAARMYRGSQILFLRMVADLAIDHINLRDFFADQIPAELEKNRCLLKVLASAQGEHSRDYEVDFTLFVEYITGPDGPSFSPLSHLQAAAFVQQLEPVQAPAEYLAWLSEPHHLCNVGVPANEVVCFHSPCCGNYVSRCCLMMKLMKHGPWCFDCLKNIVELVKNRSREKLV